MNAQPRKELRDFHQFVSEKINGRSLLSPEEVLDEWRVLHPDPGAEAEEIAAVQEAIDDLEHGDAGVPFDEFDRNFRARNNLRPRS